MKKRIGSLAAILMMLAVLVVNGCGGGGAANSAPVADAGTDRIVTINSVVTLDGSGSTDADGDQLTYNWSFTSKPGSSSAYLSDSTAVKPTFTPDVVGSYDLSLVVNDGDIDSAADTVMITAKSWTHPTSLTDNISPDGQDAYYPQVAMDNNGNAVIVWYQSDGIYYQIYF